MADDFDLNIGPLMGDRLAVVDAPEFPYRPRNPLAYRPEIGLIGCGKISLQHLRAYKAAGYEVAMLCDQDESRARSHKADFYPRAEVTTDYRKVLRRDDIEVVDITVHHQARALIIPEAIEAGKHILSQKPFVTDLDAGLRMVEQAERKGVRLAVNQNGRWAPHWSYIRAAVAAGFFGDVSSIRMAVNWDHNDRIAGSIFDDYRFVILFDFGIHWFDIVNCFMGARTALRVSALAGRSAGQRVNPPLLSQVLFDYDHGQAQVFFDANTRYATQDSTFVTGTKASAWSVGPYLKVRELALVSATGLCRPRLDGAWYPDGFHGTMGELLCAIEEKREPDNGARANLKSLELCFAAVASAARGSPVVPGKVRRLLES